MLRRIFFRVRLLEDPSIKLFYQRRLEQNLMHLPCSLNIDVEWQTLKNTLKQEMNEALGRRKKRRHKRRLILWNEDIKNLVENKKKAYLRYLTTRSETEKLECKRLEVTVKRETRKIKRQCWETFISRIEHDLHGRQISAYKIIRNLNRTEKDNLRLNPTVTAVAQWLRCCATNRKVAGSIPAGVSGFFSDIKSFRSHYGPGVDSASNRNEYQEYFLGVKAAGA